MLVYVHANNQKKYAAMHMHMHVHAFLLKFGLVEVQNGGNQGFIAAIAASKSPQYKEMPGNLTFLWFGVCDRENP